MCNGKKIKVLVVWRGPSPYRVDFFNELGKQCNLTVLFEMCPTEIRDKKIEWFHENFIYFCGIYLKHIHLFGRIRFCYNIFKYLKDYKRYDVIVLGMYSTFTQMVAIFCMKLFNIPYVINSDGGFIKQESVLSKFIKRFFISGAKGYISSSKGTAEYLKYYGAKEPYIYPFTSSKQDNVRKIIDIKYKCETKRKLGVLEEIIILYSGQFIPRKGIDILLCACKNLPTNCGVYIVGGEPRKEYLNIVQDYNLRNIHFVGFKTPIELEDYYEIADIYVLPTREDIWGLVINEAMAYGLPVITTDRCLAGMELIENGVNGFIVPVENVEILSEKIGILTRCKELRDRIRDNNIKKIQDYTIENMANAHISFFHDYCSI